ncbi:hypothetical protein D5S17_03270 [Pseudonocardiaceae bacterium YIM PH 21723]|nr:hypothetical protein D5S17_03270 [Pseudonocardiaceae bacterium YIM PH 21723]
MRWHFDPATEITTVADLVRLPDISARHGVGGGNWLYLGPTGPHVAGYLFARTAQLRDGAFFTVDLDPRWVKRLHPGAARSYVDHLLEQVGWILDGQRAEVAGCVFQPFHPHLIVELLEQDTGAPVDYGERGRVRRHHLTLDLWLPNQIERDTAIRMSAVDGVDGLSGVAPLPMVAGVPIREGV